MLNGSASQGRSKNQRFSNTRGRDNPRELAFRSALHEVGLRFRVHVRPLPTRNTIDIAFHARKVAVFLDGCFWHGCPLHGTWPKSNERFWRDKIERNVARDTEFTAALQDAGWFVLRFWEHVPLADAVRVTEGTVRGRANPSQIFAP